MQLGQITKPQFYVGSGVSDRLSSGQVRLLRERRVESAGVSYFSKVNGRIRDSEPDVPSVQREFLSHRNA